MLVTPAPGLYYRGEVGIILTCFIPTGTLMGIANIFGTIPGFLGPQVVGWFTNEEVGTVHDKKDTHGSHLSVLLSSGTEWFCRYISGLPVRHWHCGTHYHRASEATLGLYSLSSKTSYRKISWSLEAARLDVIMVVSPRNLTGASETRGVYSVRFRIGRLLTARRLKTLQGSKRGVETIHFSQFWWKIGVEIRHFPNFC